MTFRSPIHEFELANPLYVGATVTFYVADANGLKTAEAATLYAGPTTATTASNPQVLDLDGKLAAPVYHEVAVIAEVTGPNVASHDTGVIEPRAKWREDWATATYYYSGDSFRDAATRAIYIAKVDFLSQATVAADLASDFIELLFNPVPNITVSTSDPSGGIDGDIWFKVPA